MTIAENIKYLRKKNNMTQKELADKSGLAVITIQGYEAGKYEPKKESLYKLRKALDCNIYEILNTPFDLTSSISSDREPFTLEEAIEFLQKQSNMQKESHSFDLQLFADHEHLPKSITFTTIDYTENELEQIYNFAQFLKSNRVKENSE